MHHWQELAEKYLMVMGRRFPITLVRGQGVRVWDDHGKEYLDFVGGWAAASLGHCHPVVEAALSEQARNLILCSNSFYNIPQAQLAELLAASSCTDRAFLCNSGAEANEGAVKLARKYGKLHRGGAYEVISALNSFHGRTLAMVAATGQKHYQEPFTPMPQGFINVEYNSIEAIKGATTEETIAVLLEPVQGEGGVNVPDEGYLRAVRSWCDEKGLLLILDEVQTGAGRLGTLWGYQQFGVEPDIMAVGKGIGGGMPVAGFLATEKACVFVAGDHGTTYGGNPLCCAVAHAVFKHIVDNDMPARVSRVGAYLKRELLNLQERYPFVSDVRGRGLLLAVEFKGDLADAVIGRCTESGLLVNRLKPNAIRLMPPLIVTPGEVDQASVILDKALAQVEAGPPRAR